MRKQQTDSKPFIFFFLVFPYSISGGFATVTLPFLLIERGYSVSTTAMITSFGISANIIRFLWAPITDLTLSLHKWYLIGITLCASTLMLFCFIPLNINSSGLLAAVVFLSQFAATFVVNPVGGFAARTVAREKIGRAGGWYQAGNLGGAGLGGGAGLWLSNHFSYQVAVFTLSAAMLCCILALYAVPQVYAEKAGNLKEGFKIVVHDIKVLFRSPIALFTTAMIVAPVGVGAAANIWSSIATDWHATPDTVALVTGLLSGIVCTVGCVFGGWIADKMGKWWAFFGSGTLMASVTLFMSIFDLTSSNYVIGVLFYAFMMGFANASFSAVVLHAIGKGLVSTKYALLTSISNVASVYMTTFDGWMHDSYNINAMLVGETVLGLGVVAVSVLILYLFKFDKAAQTTD